MAAVSVIADDITKPQMDVIVNADDSGMLGNGRVDGAIHRMTGAELLADCGTRRGMRHGGDLLCTSPRIR